jgi:hypothetical protein
MIHKVGLLPLWNIQQVPFAYKMYTRANERGWRQSNLFKKTFSIDVDIEFVGVWLVYPLCMDLLPRFFSCSPSLTFYLFSFFFQG